MSALFALLAIAAPGAADIQALEVTRIIGANADTARDGRLNAEFAPSVETRGGACERIAAERYDCRYEVRTKGFFDTAFGAWKSMAVRLQRKGGRWRIVEPAK